MGADKYYSKTEGEYSENDKEIERLKNRIEELEKKELQFDALLDTIPIAIYFKDKESKFIKASKFHANAFQVKSANDMIGKSDFDFHFKEHANKAYEEEQNILKSGKPLLDSVEKVVRADNSVRWLVSTKLPVKNKDGKNIGIMGVGRDITSIKEMELSLIDKNNDLVTAEEELRQTIEELQTVQEELLKQKEHVEQQKEKILLQNNKLAKHKNNLEGLVRERTKELYLAKERAEESDQLKSAF